MRRRRLLAALAGASGLGGCLRLQSGDDATDTPTATTGAGTPTVGRRTPTATDDAATATETAATGPLSGSWPMAHRDAANTGFDADGRGPVDGVALRWRYDVDVAVTSSPVVADGVAFLTDVGGDNGRVRAVDTGDGSLRWRQRVPGVGRIGAPAVADGRVFVGTQPSRRLFALSADAGSYVWRADLPAGAFNSPTVADGTAYVTTMDGAVHAFDAATGDRRWTYDPDVRTMLSTPAVADGTVYATSFTPRELPDGAEDVFEVVNPNRLFMWADLGEEPHRTVSDLDVVGRVHAVDAAAGEARWTATLPDLVVSSPAVADGTVCVGCWDRRLYGLSAADGSERWHHATEATVSGTPAVADGTAYVGSWDGSLYAVSVADGTREWFSPLGDKVNAAPAVTADAVYAVADNTAVAALTRDGRERWRYEGPIGDYNASSPAVVDGAVLVCGDSRRVTEDGSETEHGSLFLLDEGA